jgi:hypothetical protein
VARGGGGRPLARQVVRRFIFTFQIQQNRHRPAVTPPFVPVARELFLFLNHAPSCDDAAHGEV